MFSSSYPRRNSSSSTSGTLPPQESQRQQRNREGDPELGTPRQKPRRRLTFDSDPVPISRSPPSPPTQLGKQNSRSFFHSSYHDSQNDIDKSLWPQYSSSGVREHTAELANLVLSDVNSIHNGTPPGNLPSSHLNHNLEGGFLPGSLSRANNRVFLQLRSADVINEVSEPTTPDELVDTKGKSYLTHLLRSSPPKTDPKAEDKPASSEGQSMVDDIVSSCPPLTEQSSLLPKAHPDGIQRRVYGTISRNDDGNQTRDPYRPVPSIGIKKVVTWPSAKGLQAIKSVFHYKTWNREEMWEKGVVKTTKCLPAVFLGLLLNILDGLSYGMILFPLGHDIFNNLGPDGLSIFYVSCIVSQLVYSCGGSVFKGGVGSEMIEVVPFFHKMAITILNRVGEDNPKSVLATTVVSYALSSILTGVVFFGLGAMRLGSLIGFFPRHILVGCIGGVGWFLVATGLEVSARLEGNLNYDLSTLHKLIDPSTFALWIVPLFLAVFLIFCQKFIKWPLFVPLYFLFIPALFFIVVAAVPQLNIVSLRENGWLFDAPADNVPFWHFYTLYDFKEVDWRALLSTVPAMFALTFFGILHVPINVPALGVSTGEDNVNVDRELIAHGVSNALSGLLGSIQNYLVYTNSILFIRSGGDSRVAGVMLALGTAGIMMIGPSVIGYIPIMVVGALIFLLGIELLREALYDTWGKLSKLEYLTICIIVITMGAWDFVIGIVIGIILACMSFVVQASRKSAIRATYSGVFARSTVRRHPIQQRFLRQVGRQIQVYKLAGYIFFGTVSSVENTIRNLLKEQNFEVQPIRYLIIDVGNVTGIDFSAAEAFTRMRRLLGARKVEMILSGVKPDDEVGRGLRAVGLWGDNDKLQVFEDLNAALESCENEFLSALYRQRDEIIRRERDNESRHLDVPNNSGSGIISVDASLGSPRRNLVHQAATSTIKDEQTAQPSKWQNFKQPLPLILQVFSEMTDKNEDFWFKAVPFFQRREYPEGTVLFCRGDKPTEFYLLEEGIFVAEYDLEQGKFFESIVAGTTCGELPFFSETNRTANMFAEKDTVAWVLDQENWRSLQDKEPDVAKELLKLSLKLTSERMGAITR
ncbi:sulfate transporter family-domain-containing protein [Morchella snyderi]|nr:sulfate transporter family-domain-containing protein [Morchella snyderi]